MKNFFEIAIPVLLCVSLILFTVNQVLILKSIL